MESKRIYGGKAEVLKQQTKLDEVIFSELPISKEGVPSPVSFDEAPLEILSWLRERGFTLQRGLEFKTTFIVPMY